VGGEFASRVFVTNVLPPTEQDPPSHREYLRFVEQARDRKTVVVAGGRLADIGKILANQVTKPEYPRI
jgi:hypothetical protein